MRQTRIILSVLSNHNTLIYYEIGVTFAVDSD